MKGSWEEAREQCWDWGGELSFPLLSNNTTPKSWLQDHEEVCKSCSLHDDFSLKHVFIARFGWPERRNSTQGPPFHLLAPTFKKGHTWSVFLICGDVQTMDHTSIRVVLLEPAKKLEEDFVRFHPGELSVHHQTALKQLIPCGGSDGPNKCQNQWQNNHVLTTKEDK